MIACSTVLLPYRAAASTENKTAIVFEIKNLSTIKIPTNYTAKEEIAVTDDTAELQEQVFEQNVAILQDYLNKKGSPLAPYAADILKAQNWKLVLAISNGESTMCKHQRYYNCWGVGGAWNLRRYASFSEGFADVDRLLTNRYIADGLDTPAEMVNRYVGHANSNWVYANNKILQELDNLPLVQLN
jgi:hypothetical protein